jgi:predicted DCC family thiol-disulfide oxidoreductase YuxK
MVDSKAQPSSAAVAGAHLVLYDGVCGLCGRLLQFLLRHDRRRVFSFASLQSAVGRSIVERSGGNPAELTSFYVVADYQTAAARVFSRSDAALFVAGALGWPWRTGQLIRFVPQAIRDRAYDVVARSRYRVFGRYDRCLVPRPEFRSRFIDGQAGDF